MSSPTLSGDESAVAEELAVVLHACAVGRSDVLSKAISSLKITKTTEEVASAISALRNDENESPLHTSSKKGYSDVIRILLSNGVDPSLRVKRQKAYEIGAEGAKKTFFSYLFERIAMRDLPQIRKLLLGGVPVVLNRDSALTWACSFGYEDVVGLLLECGANVNDTDAQGLTPLHVACKGGFVDIARLLLHENCNTKIKNNQGLLALELAASEEMRALVTTHIEPSFKFTQLAVVTAAEIAEEERQQEAREDKVVRQALYQAGFIDSDDEPEREDDTEERKSAVEAAEKPPKRELLLWPFPQRYEFLEGAGLVLDAEPLLLCVASKSVDVLPLLTWSGFIDLFAKLHIPVEVQRSPTLAKVRIAIDANLCPGMHRYHIKVSSASASILASDSTGLMYALYTFTQYLQLYGEVKDNDSNKSIRSRIHIPAIDILDWPDVLHRSVMWSYKDSCLSSSTTLKSMIVLFSKLRINRLILLLNDEDKNDGVDETSINIYAIDEVCRRYSVDLIPAVVLASPSQILSPSCLHDFSNTTLCMIFLYNESNNAENCIKACRESMLLAQSSGITSLNIACTPWMSKNCSPLDIASNLGLRGLEQELDSLCSFNLSMKSLSGVESIIENISRYSQVVHSKGLASAVLPGLLESFFSSPLILTKFYTFLHAGYSWNRAACVEHFEAHVDISILKDTVRMVLFPTQFYSQSNTSDAFHNTGVILNLLSNASTLSSSSIANKSAKLHTTENILWCLVNSFDDVSAMEAPPKELVMECLRNYKRCLSSSRWKLGSKAKRAIEGTSLDADVMEALDAEEFFCTMYLVCTLCKLIVYGYNALEKKHSGANTSRPSFHTLISTLPVGTKTDIANSFLEALEHCMFIWRQRFETLHFSLVLGQNSTSLVDVLAAARTSYLKQQRPFPAVKLLKVLCDKLPIQNSVEGVLERIFGVQSFSERL